MAGVRRILRAVRAGVRDCARYVTELMDEDLQRGISADVRRLGARGECVEFVSSVRVEAPERMKVGSYVYANARCRFVAQGGLTIEDFTIFGADVLVLTTMHRYRGATLLPYDGEFVEKPVHVGRAVWVGARSIVLPGVEIGEGCVVGAGAVVSRSVPRGSIVAGNPARVVGERDPEHFDALSRAGAYYMRRKCQERSGSA